MELARKSLRLGEVGFARLFRFPEIARVYSGKLIDIIKQKSGQYGTSEARERQSQIRMAV